MTKKELKELIRETLREELAIRSYIAEAVEKNYKAPITKYNSFIFDDLAAKVASEVLEDSEFKKMLNSSIDTNLVVYDDDIVDMIKEKLTKAGVSESNLEETTTMVCSKLETMTDKIARQAKDYSSAKDEIKKAGNIGGKRIG